MEKDATNRVVGMHICEMLAEERSKRSAEMLPKATREELLSKIFIGTYCSLKTMYQTYKDFIKQSKRLQQDYIAVKRMMTKI